MYIPDHFRPSDDDVLALLREHGAVDLITSTAQGLLATMLPMAWDEPGSRPGLGECGALLGHVAIKNDQWREPALGAHAHVQIHAAQVIAQAAIFVLNVQHKHPRAIQHQLLNRVLHPERLAATR